MKRKKNVPSRSASAPPVAIVTGGGTGIGRATALRFAREGWRVIVTGRRLAKLREVAAHSPRSIFPMQCDLSKSAAIAAFAKLVSRKEFAGSIQVLVNNAGQFERMEFEKTELAVWRRLFDINLFAPVELTRALLPYLAKTRGVVVNVSSTLGVRPIPSTSAYSASKAAMVNWTQALALEVGARGIRANAVCPGIVDTPIQAFHERLTAKQRKALGALQPLGRIGRPEDVAHAIWSLCAPGADWITGASLVVDGGILLR